MSQILLIDDDAQLGGPLTTYLARYDMQLSHALSPSAGMACLQAQAFDAVILDLMLPERDGFAVCRDIRQSSDIPILMLTARGDVTDRVVGLEMGADDYLPKPFDPRELVARLHSITRRASPSVPAGGVIDLVDLRIDRHQRSAVCGGQTLALTTAEFDILALLASRPGQVLSRDEILNTLHGHSTEVFSRAVDITVSRLRKKLQPLDAIKTVRHVGYMLTLRPSS